jgi:hypothetical protein
MRLVVVAALAVCLTGCLKTQLINPRYNPRGEENLRSPPGAPDVYDLGINVSKKGFFIALGGSYLTAEGQLLPPGSPRPQEPTIPHKDGAYDYEKLVELIAVLKEKRPQSPKVTFSSDEDLPLGSFLETVEKVRKRGGEALFPEALLFGPEKEGRKK